MTLSSYSVKSSGYPPSPVQVKGLSDVVLYAARDYHNLAVKSDGTVWAWGSGGNGELGDEQTVDSPLPVQVIFYNWLFLPVLNK